jgi:hypothetical protein
MKLAEVVTLYETNASHIPDMLRKRADLIESQTENDDRAIAMIAVEVTESGDLEIYEWGQTDNFHCLGVLAMASARLAAGPSE